MTLWLESCVLAGLVLAAGILLGRRWPFSCCPHQVQPGPRRVGGYRLVEPIGGGAMGDVWIAEHERLGRAAAVKLIKTDRLQGEQREVALRRFEREARALARMTSNHTVTLYEYGEDPDGTRFYAMELLDGVDLETLVELTGPFSPARAVHVLRQVSSALSEAHRLGILHRDVKPANVVLLPGDPEPDLAKVLDFGLAQDALEAQDPRLTAEGFTVGTAAIMAPEVIEGGRADASSEVYALGCVAYWLLTGRFPFQGGDIRAILLQHLTRAPAPPSSQRPRGAIPKLLDELVLACLEKNPSRRPASMAEVSTRLDRVARVVGSWSREEAAQAWREWDLANHSDDDPEPPRAEPSATTAPLLRLPRRSTRRVLRPAG